MVRATPAVLDTLKPMLLTPRKAVPRDAGWLVELKFKYVPRSVAFPNTLARE